MTSAEKQSLSWALVPLKSRERAKSRLATVLSPEQRTHLFFRLAERVIRTLQATRGVDAVAVITASAEIAAFARSLGATPILQSADFGMSAAFEQAVGELQITNAQRVLMLPGDLPLISSAALEALLTTAGNEPGVVVVPDRHRTGTNALLCAPPRALSPCFGGHSFERHIAAAKTANVKAQVFEHDALALDLDHPEDLDYLQTQDAALAAELLIAKPAVTTAAHVEDRCAARAVNQ